jgi:hypothetical protein
MIAASPNDTHYLRPTRAERMLSALIEGAGLEAIAARERLPAKEVQAILREELDLRWVAPLADFAKIQIRRLENFCLLVMDRVENGELAAIDRALKIIDRLDRYHGFHRASPAVEPYGEEERERLIAKINDMAERLRDSRPEPVSDS